MSEEQSSHRELYRRGVHRRLQIPRSKLDLGSHYLRRVILPATTTRWTRPRAEEMPTLSTTSTPGAAGTTKMGPVAKETDIIEPDVSSIRTYQKFQLVFFDFHWMSLSRWMNILADVDR